MKILQKTTKEKMELYNLMTPEKSTNMKDKVGQDLEIKNFVLFEEIDDFDTKKKSLSIQTVDNEIVFCTSKSFIREFEKLTLIFGKIKKLEVTSELSNNGYEVLNCSWLA